MVEIIMAKLKKRYNLTGGGDLQWFLGMEIIGDRRKGYAALTHPLRRWWCLFLGDRRDSSAPLEA